MASPWVVTSRELALVVARDPELFTVEDPRMSVRAVLGANMLTTDRPEQLRHRSPFAEPFRRNEVHAEFTAFVEATAGELVAAVAVRGSADLRTALAAPLALQTVARALGIEASDPDAVLDWYAAFAEGMTAAAGGSEPSRRAREALAAFGRTVEEHLAADGSSLLRAVAGDPAHDLALDELVSNAALIMFGGIETTESMILNALWLLLTHPDQLALLRERPELLENAIEESLRCEAAVASFERFATCDTMLGDDSVRAGDAVTVLAGPANRDPCFFPDPERFDITRPNARHHLAFAAGPHVCLGMHLARLEARVAVATVLEQLPGLELDAARSTPPSGLVFRKPEALVVRWQSPEQARVRT
jgi:cytochrome P450